ncbi:hypothetical protein K431DRAFT_289716 [Polychaeton citri CBS 116435]|uniref:Uncharacterized protein n=1 Tax=Polychaeton citri CBS 116435 TaxID=1314669 RepID=A0A9P4PW67_9PEZI|nr:hypothetical protein K431DRAFT_289716 [Polychaeton citri CBS 116435]
MAISSASIPRETANAARQDLERYNEILISGAEARDSHFVPLDYHDSLKDLRDGLDQFEKDYIRKHPNTEIAWKQPVLCVRKPSSPPLKNKQIIGCLGLGKIGGEEAMELSTGSAFVWEPQEEQDFGTSMAIYVGFKINAAGA